MELKLTRTSATSARTLGELYVDGKHECYTLERSPTDPEHPSIPAGRYAVYPWKSPKFHRVVLRFVNVPLRTDILVHVGNTTEDSHGCVLVGQDRHGDVLLHSGLALESLLDKVTRTVDLVITDPKETA